MLLMTYIIEDDNIGNVDTSIAFTNPDYVGIEGVNNETFNIFPVPASSKVRITAGAAISNIELFDMNGRSAAVVAANGSTQAVIGVADLPAGIYLVRMQFSNGKISHQKLIVAH